MFDDADLPKINENKILRTTKDSNFKLKKFNNEGVNGKFEIRREKWTTRILHLQKLLPNETLSELQVLIFAERQRAVEEKFKLQAFYTVLNRRVKEDTERLFIELETNSDLKVKSVHDRRLILDSRIADKSERLELIDNQISFFTETIKTIDGLTFAIKDRIAWTEYFNV